MSQDIQFWYENTLHCLVCCLSDSSPTFYFLVRSPILCYDASQILKASYLFQCLFTHRCFAFREYFLFCNDISVNSSHPGPFPGRTGRPGGLYRTRSIYTHFNAWIHGRTLQPFYIGLLNLLATLPLFVTRISMFTEVISCICQKRFSSKDLAREFCKLVVSFAKHCPHYISAKVTGSRSIIKGGLSS